MPDYFLSHFMLYKNKPKCRKPHGYCIFARLTRKKACDIVRSEARKNIPSNGQSAERRTPKTPEAVTARGWENLSRTLYIMDDLKITATADLVSQFIKSDRVVYDFMGYLTLHAIECRQSDLNAIILAGKYHEEYAEKWRDLPETTLWLLADHFFCFLTSKKDKSPEFNTYYENIFHFLDLLGNRLVKERVFSQVNKDPYMVKMLVCTHNNTYKRLCGEFLNAG